jgi:hypothetical protein
MTSTLSCSVNGVCRLSATEAAYFAGFVDGEGTISVARTKRRESRTGYRFRPYLSVANTNIDVLRSLLTQCGNGRILCKYSTFRCCPDRKELYALDLGAAQMRRVLPAIQPYLRVKKRQAELLMEFLSISVYGHQNTEAEWQRVLQIHSELRALNHRGTRPIVPVTGVVRPSRWKNQWGASGQRIEKPKP